MKGMEFEGLAELLEPCLCDEFLASSWGRSYRHVRGRQGKFSRLLPWDSLNEILTAHRLDYPRLRLMQEGKSLPTSSYIRHVGGGKGKPSIPRLLHVELANQLRNGATLVLDAVDELHDAVRELSRDLERIFHERVQVNCYAGWRASRGFDLHWDDHDVFILQIEGRKQWSIYGMTTPYPIKGGRDPIPRPTHEPIWSGILEDGDLLYIPRGWWHVAVPLDEPTLHLTVGIHNRTGAHFIQWFSQRLAASESFRKDLPRFQSLVESNEHMKNLYRELLDEWDANLLDIYFRELDAMAEPRPSVSLPWSASVDGIPNESDAVVRLNAPRPLDLAVRDGILEFECNKKRWKFAAGALPLFRLLNTCRISTIAELCDETKDELDEKTVRTFLRELLVHGLVAITRR